MGISGGNKSFPKISIKTLISMNDPLQHKSRRNNNHAGNQCFKPETNDKLQFKTKTNSNNTLSEINLKDTNPDDYQDTSGHTYVNDPSRKNNNKMINKKEVQTKCPPVKTNSIDEFLRSVKRTKMKYQEMLQSDHNALQGKTASTDSHENASNNLKQMSGIVNSEPKPGKDATLQDENCIQMNEIAQNRFFLIPTSLRHLHHKSRRG